SLQARVNDSPCRHCPYLADHRAHRQQVVDIEATLGGAEGELEAARHRFQREFRAYRAVLRDAGFLEDDRPTALGLLAASLYGESALLIADGIAAGTFARLTSEELAATLVMLVAEDRGRDRPRPGRRHLPTARMDRSYRSLRSALLRLATRERVERDLIRRVA